MDATTPIVLHDAANVDPLMVKCENRVYLTLHDKKDNIYLAGSGPGGDVGTTTPCGYSMKYFVKKIDSTGTILWQENH